MRTVPGASESRYFVGWAVLRAYIRVSMTHILYHVIAHSAVSVTEARAQSQSFQRVPS
jgi:hypothetical protein